MPALAREDVAARNTLRNNGIALGKFQQLLDLPKHEQKLGLLGFVQEVYDTAMAKQVHTKSDSYDNPDCHSAGKMIEVARTILEMGDDKPEDLGGDGDSRAVDLAKAAARLEAERRKAA